MAKRRQSQDDKDVLKEARARFRESNDADTDNRRDALDDLKFLWNLNNYQWDDTAKNIRKGRPMMVENRLPQFVRQIVNGQRLNRPTISVKAASGDASAQVAKVIEGMVRHVEQWSRADLAYDNAFEAAVSSSIGYFRVTTEYADDEGFDQEICIRPIDNAFSVYDDPSYQLPDASDRKYCFVTELVKPDAFEEEYGFKPTPIDEAGLGDDSELWYDDDRVCVAEYWRVRIERDTLENEGRSRDVEHKVVEQFLMTGDRIIKKSDWAGSYIPIIPVFGECKNIEGRKYRKSLIRDAKESQKVNNYFLSAEVESISLQPKAPFIGAAGAFETDDKKWASANAENHAYLQYDPIENAPPPQRQPPPAFPAGLREIRMASIEAMKAQMGIYDASLGARSNETSGVAIENRQQQGDQSTYHYIDNMVRAIRYAGTVIIDLLPKVYDAPRVVRILEPDGEAQFASINQVFIDPNTLVQQPGLDITAGRYDVVVKAGPSFQTQRQENAAAITQLVKAYPPLAQAAGDILIKNMDFPDADKIAERLKGLFDKQQQGVPPQLQEQMHKMQQALQQAQKQVQDLTHANQKQELELMGKDLAIRDKGQSNQTQDNKVWIDVILKLLQMGQAQTQHVDSMGQAQSGMEQAQGQHADKMRLEHTRHEDGMRQSAAQMQVDQAAQQAAQAKDDAAKVAAG